MFNWKNFTKDVSDRLARENMMEICKEYKIAPSTFMRLYKGKKCSLDNIIKICKFLGHSVEWYIHD